ncbi:MAG: PA0069 family radical SAM protein [Planctomycetota bacterium]
MGRADPGRATNLVDGIPGAPVGVRGRGAGLNPGNRHEGSDPRRGVIRRLHVLGDTVDDAIRAGELETGPAAAGTVRTQVIFERTRTVLNRVDSPDLPFSWTINPYRGCEHGCVYCYARPDHERLGYSCGLDFETRIIAKPDAPILLRRELARPRWRAEMIAMSGVTDCYQPVERDLNITRGCLEIMAASRQPVGIVTKSRLVLRDLDHLADLASHQAIRVAVSVTTLDNRLASTLEPRASSPTDRLETIRQLRERGIPTTVLVAPIIPGLNDREVPAILEAAAGAGALAAAYILLRLPHQLKALWTDWLDRHLPERAAHIESLVRQTRDGGLYDSTFGRRQRGRGPVAEQIGQIFRTFSRRHGLDRDLPPLSGAAFRSPAPGEVTSGQMPLFGE